MVSQNYYTNRHSHNHNTEIHGLLHLRSPLLQGETRRASSDLCLAISSFSDFQCLLLSDYHAGNYNGAMSYTGTERNRALIDPTCSHDLAINTEAQTIATTFRPPAPTITITASPPATTTKTVSGPATTLPAICKPSLFLDYRGGVDREGFGGLVQTSDATKQACCVACFKAKDCTAFQFRPDNGPEARCEYFTRRAPTDPSNRKDICPLGVTKGSELNSPSNGGPGDFFLNYGPCLDRSPLRG
jgi:hypothetical protein